MHIVRRSCDDKNDFVSSARHADLCLSNVSNDISVHCIENYFTKSLQISHIEQNANEHMNKQTSGMIEEAGDYRLTTLLITMHQFAIRIDVI